MTKQYTFGSGVLAAVPASGNDPIVFGALQDVSMEFTGEIKQLHGQYGFALAAAKGKQKVDIKAGNGAIDVDLYNNTYFGQASGLAAGCKKFAQGEAGTIPSPSGPYTITVANSGTFYAVMQVVNASTGARMTQVASGPTTGQFSVAAGVFTFAAADAGVPVLFDYLYTDASNGRTITLTNQLMGVAPSFKLLLAEKYDTSTLVVQLNKVVGAKLSMPLKQDDFMISELELAAFTDSTNTLGFISLTG